MEVHFFISDALFNNKTGKILKKSLLAFKNSVRIYMSATPDEILPVITQKSVIVLIVIYILLNILNIIVGMVFTYKIPAFI